jgi:hypothetical protein
MGGSDTPAILLERDNTCLSRKHLDGDPQDARQQLLEVELLGEGARDFEQIITLSDAEIGQHNEIDAILSLLSKANFVPIWDRLLLST